MANEQSTKSPDDDGARENARIGYQVSADLAAHYGSCTEDRISSLMLANSILIGAISLVVSAQRPMREFLLLLSLGGILLNILWSLSLRRSYNQFKYYIRSASELEEHYLSNQVETLSRGERFVDGEKVSWKRGKKCQSLQMPWYCRKVKAEWITYLAILVFMTIYGVSLWFSLPSHYKIHF
jgi:hypothetical protein